MTDEALNELALVLAVAGAVPILGATLTYAFGSPWWRSWLGRIMLALFVALVVTFALILARRLFGDYLGYGLVAVVAYSYIAATLWAVWGIILVERRNPAPVATLLTRERKNMTDKTKTLAERTVSPKVIASGIAGAAFVIVGAAIAAITPELLEPIGPWSVVAFAAIQGLGQVVAGYIKTDPLR